jgi:hypothetical protein
MTSRWAPSDRALTAGADAPALHMSRKHNVTRALATSLAAAALAAPSDEVQPPDAAAAAPALAQARSDASGGARAPDRLAPHTRKATTPTWTPAGTPDAPTVVEITPAHGFDWTSAAIGAAAGIALALIALAAAATLSGRSRPAPH